MFITQISENIAFQYFLGFILWQVLYYFLSQYINFSFQNSHHIKKNLHLFFVFLSIIAVVRIFYNVLPITSDSFLYLTKASGIMAGDSYDVFGSGIYSYIIALVELLVFKNIYVVIFLNVTIFLIGIMEVIKQIPDYEKRDLSVFFLLLFIYPAIIWFIPNILREAIFFLCIVKTYKYSQTILAEEYLSKSVFKLFIFSSIAIIIRTQVLPILMLWFVYLAFKKNYKFAIFPTLVLLILFFTTPLKDEYLRKISFDYIQAYKNEASSGLGFIAYTDLIVPENITQLIQSMPMLLMRFVLSPFPWNLTYMQYTFAYIDALYVLTIVLMLVYRILKNQIWSWSLIIFVMIFLITFGVFEIAFTGAARHRMTFIILLIPLVIPSYRLRDTNENKI